MDDPIRFLIIEFFFIVPMLLSTFAMRALIGICNKNATASNYSESLVFI